MKVKLLKEKCIYDIFDGVYNLNYCVDIFHTNKGYFLGYVAGNSSLNGVYKLTKKEFQKLWDKEDLSDSEFTSIPMKFKKTKIKELIFV